MSAGYRDTARPSPERLLYRPEEVAEMLGFGRAKTYALLGSGEIKSLKIGANRRITRSALEEFIAGLSDGTAAGVA